MLKGKKIGKYQGKVAIRDNGYFNITTKNSVIQGIHCSCCSIIQKGDGYAYMVKTI